MAIPFALFAHEPCLWSDRRVIRICGQSRSALKLPTKPPTWFMVREGRHRFHVPKNDLRRVSFYNWFFLFQIIASSKLGSTKNPPLNHDHFCGQTMVGLNRATTNFYVNFWCVPRGGPEKATWEVVWPHAQERQTQEMRATAVHLGPLRHPLNGPSWRMATFHLDPEAERVGFGRGNTPWNGIE